MKDPREKEKGRERERERENKDTREKEPHNKGGKNSFIHSFIK